MTNRMPRYGQAFLLPSGAIAPVWYDYLRSLDASSLTAEIERQVQANTEAIKALQQAGFGDYLPASAYILGINSVQTFGDLKDGARVLLRGDVALPDPTTYYGANADQERGFHPVSDTVEAVEGELTKDVGADGVSTFGLADVPDAGGGDLRKFDRDAKGRVTGTSVPTTDDLDEGEENLYFTDERADARADGRIAAAKADPNGVASLVGGKLDAGQLPALAITDTYPVFTEAEMLALPAQQGDVAVRLDLQTSFILAAEPASTLSNWQELLSPTGGVTSFNGRTGPVMPATGDYTASQVGAAASDDPRLINSREWTASTVSQAEAEAGTATARRAWTAQRVHQAVRAAVLTGLSTATSAAITATDTVLAAFGKLQAQINNRVSNTGDEDIAGTKNFTGTTAVSGIRLGGASYLNGVAGYANIYTRGVDGSMGFRVRGGPSSGYGDLFLVDLSGNIYSSGNILNGTTSGLFGSGKEIAVSAGTSGNNISHVSLQGSRTGTAQTFSAVNFYHQANRVVSFEGSTDGSSDSGKFVVNTKAPGANLAIAFVADSARNWLPGSDNITNVGNAQTRVKEVFSVTGTINTSDAREKTDPRDLTEAELLAAADIARLPCIFQWLHAIEEKGEDARLHASPTVQAVIAAMEAHGLDPFRYGFVCFDQWDEQPEIRDEWPDEYDDEGNLIREAGSEVTQEYRPAGDRYSLRPTELAHFVLRGLAHRQDELERRLAALESE